ncbi:MAG: hypothetical protein HYZ65_16165 [Burkholderiales bacterium]|nr:hypothetical protein [Burkholderiales bacterium]
MNCVAGRKFLALVMLLNLTACADAPIPMRKPFAKPVSSQAPIELGGELTLKGSEYNAWFALRDDKGKLWRLESDDGKLLQQLRAWQNRRVKVVGLPLPKMLVDRLKIISVAPE